jgi:hypothetical protein
MYKFTLALTVLLLIATAAFAQQAILSAPATATPTTSPATSSAPLYPEKAPDDPFTARLIPRNSKVYIKPSVAEDPTKPQAEGFENYLAAALRKKNVPLIIVADPSIADFVIGDTADAKGAGFAKKWLLGDFRRTTTASIAVINTRTGVVAYADSSHRASANRGLRSSAEKLAKYLKEKIEKDAKHK